MEASFTLVANFSLVKRMYIRFLRVNSLQSALRFSLAMSSARTKTISSDTIKGLQSSNSNCDEEPGWRVLPKACVSSSEGSEDSEQRIEIPQFLESRETFLLLGMKDHAVESLGNISKVSQLKNLYFSMPPVFSLILRKAQSGLGGMHAAIATTSGRRPWETWG